MIDRIRRHAWRVLMKRVSCLPGLALLLAALAGAMPAAAQPAGGTVRIIVPFPPGGPTDLLARTVAQKTAEMLGQPVVIENRPGAGGVLGTEALARARPDGTTFGLGTNGTHAINASLYSKLPFDPARDFAPVVMLASTANLVVVRSESRFGSLADLVAAARAAPGRLTMGSAGNGTTPHLSGVLFNSVAGIQTLHVPYKGSAAALTDLLGGQIDYTFEGIAVALPHMRSGKLRALAVTSRQRHPLLPQVPSIAELGYPDYEVTSWGAIFAPAGTPAEAIGRFNEAVNRALREPDLRRKLEELSFAAQGGTPAELAEVLRRELARWPALVREAGARVD